MLAEMSICSWPSITQRTKPLGLNKSHLTESVEDFRERLSHSDALPQLVSLGVISGILAALIIVGFRWLFETPLLMAMGDSEGFESLTRPARFLLPCLGAIGLGLVFNTVDPATMRVSVSHVLERLHNNNGALPFRNIVVQFCGGVIALLSGQSVGREGPCVHLGAGTASQLGQWLGLPRNSLRTLVACGAAAGISASFNTPMAGVIFAMEVILMEYTIVGFIPVIVASVLSAVISQLVFGSDISFDVDTRIGVEVAVIPYMLVAGLIFGIAAVAFTRLHMLFFRLHRYSLLLRFTVIGVVTSLIAVFVPEIMGTGYDTLADALNGVLTLEILLLVVLAKLAVTALATGLGMFGGLIGPSLVIGGCLGGALGLIGGDLMPVAIDPKFFVLLGMVAMMGAVLNAPMAALVATLELSHSPEMIFPSMLTVVVACLILKQGFGSEGVFTEQLRHHGHDILSDHGKGFLSRVGVASVMNKSFVICHPDLSLGQAKALVSQPPIWLLVKGTDADTDTLQLIPTAELARWLESAELGEMEATDRLQFSEMNLASYASVEIDSLASLHEASNRLRSAEAEALVVVPVIKSEAKPVLGVITKTNILNYYGM